jgi:hypothetical protein
LSSFYDPPGAALVGNPVFKSRKIKMMVSQTLLPYQLPGTPNAGEVMFSDPADDADDDEEDCEGEH